MCESVYFFSVVFVGWLVGCWLVMILLLRLRYVVTRGDVAKGAGKTEAVRFGTTVDGKNPAKKLIW